MARLVVVADGGQARLFKATAGPGVRRLTELETLTRPSLHITKRDMTTDIAGRVFSYATRGVGGRFKSTPHGAASDYDPHAAEVQRFAKRLAQRLDSIRKTGVVNDYVLLVEPRFLGTLRQALPPATRKIVSKEMSRDFVHADVTTIERAAARA
jgi:protein required for attachment to host cells